MRDRIRSTGALLAVILVLGTVSATTARPLSPPWAPEPPFSSETATVTLDGHAVDAEVADTAALRERGLSYRDGLEPGTGMLFVYGSAEPRGFWMYEMRFCLDIIWITDGRVAGAAEGICPAESPDAEIPRAQSPEPVQYVLEVEAGWMEEQGVESGDPVEIVLPKSGTDGG